MTDAVSALAESGAVIHQLVKDVRSALHRIAQDPAAVDRLTHKRIVANGKRIDALFGEFLAELTSLCDADAVNVATRYVPNIMELRLQPALRSALAAVRVIDDGDVRASGVPPGRALDETGLDAVLVRIDRYVCAVAIRLGRPIGERSVR